MNISFRRKELKTAIQGLTKVIPRASTLPILRGVRFDIGGDGTVTAEATDLEQCVRYLFTEAEAEGRKPFVIGADHLRDLAKGAGNDLVEFRSEDAGHITLVNHIGSQTVRQPVAIMDADEWPTSPAEAETKPGEGFLETYRRLVPFASTDETRYLLNGVYIEVAGKVTFYGRGPDDAQWTTLTLDGTRYEGERSFVGLNRFYVLDALAAGFRTIAITDELSPVVSRDANGGTHVLMPIRVTDPEDTGEQAAVPAQPEPPAEALPQGKEPAAEDASEKPKRRSKIMVEKNGTTEQGTALDKLLTAVDTAKGKLREAASSLAEVADAAKTAVKEGKAQGGDLEKARTTLQKLQAISL